MAGAGAHKAPRAGQLQCCVVHIHRQQPRLVPLSQRDGLLQRRVVVQAQVVSEPEKNADSGLS